MEQKIPVLNCLWNDVIHFSAVHPMQLKEALKEAGKPEDFKGNFFEIDPHWLAKEQTIVYLYKHNNKADSMKEENFAIFNPDNMAQYSILLEFTKVYYKEMYAQGKSPLRYHGMPHILFKGSIDFKKCKIVKV